MIIGEVPKCFGMRENYPMVIGGFQRCFGMREKCPMEIGMQRKEFWCKIY